MKATMAINQLPVQLPTGWSHPNEQVAKSLLAEFQRELPPGHLLFGRHLVVVGTREDSDDVLLSHLDEPGRLTVVHPTWSGRQEPGNDFPWIEFDGDTEAFLAWTQ
jgi:hypothetical protein